MLRRVGPGHAFWSIGRFPFFLAYLSLSLSLGLSPADVRRCRPHFPPFPSFWFPPPPRTPLRPCMGLASVGNRALPSLRPSGAADWWCPPPPRLFPAAPSLPSAKGQLMNPLNNQRGVVAVLRRVGVFLMFACGSNAGRKTKGGSIRPPPPPPVSVYFGCGVCSRYKKKKSSLVEFFIRGNG